MGAQAWLTGKKVEDERVLYRQLTERLAAIAKGLEP
jgi:hypothetical protein